jgi:hypothetical protein
MPSTRAGQPGLDRPGLRDLHNGRWAATVEQLVEHGDYALTEDPPCNADATATIQIILVATMAAMKLSWKVAMAAGPFIVPAARELDKLLRGTGGSIAAFLSPNRSANCALLVAKIPVGAKIATIKLMAGDGDRGYAVCHPDAAGNIICSPVDYCRWDKPVVDAKTGIVSSVFKNSSNDRARLASMTVEFTPPPGWKPLTLDQLDWRSITSKAQQKK